MKTKTGTATRADFSAVEIVNKEISIDEAGPCERGFKWVQIKGIRIYNCYCSPNTGIVNFTDFVTRLENSIRTSKVPTLVAGDFNAHFPSWGSPKEDKRGEILADMIATTNFNICNIVNESTFVRGASRTHIDIALASKNLMSHVKNWRVLDEESLSLHSYIMYEVKEKSPRRAQQVCTK